MPTPSGMQPTPNLVGGLRTPVQKQFCSTLCSTNGLWNCIQTERRGSTLSESVQAVSFVLGIAVCDANVIWPLCFVAVPLEFSFTILLRFFYIDIEREHKFFEKIHDACFSQFIGCNKDSTSPFSEPCRSFLVSTDTTCKCSIGPSSLHFVAWLSFLTLQNNFLDGQLEQNFCFKSVQKILLDTKMKTNELLEATLGRTTKGRNLQPYHLEARTYYNF